MCHLQKCAVGRNVFCCWQDFALFAGVYVFVGVCAVLGESKCSFIWYVWCSWQGCLFLRGVCVLCYNIELLLAGVCVVNRSAFF